VKEMLDVGAVFTLYTIPGKKENKKANQPQFLSNPN
jgi:hypothetical protein